MATRTDDIAPARSGSARLDLRGTLPAWLVFAIALCATALAWYLTHTAAQREARQRFETEVGAVQVDLAERLRAYEQILRGGVSVFHSWPSVTRDNWRSYVEHSQIRDSYPGIQGVGYAQVVSAADRQAHMREVRAEGFPEYRIWPEGEREVYTSVVYLEPFDWRNQRAFGYDMFQEPIRRAAMERARDTGLPSVSGKVTLVQETEKAVQAGFLMYLPVYGTSAPADVADRRQQLIGYVYSPFRADNFMRGLLGDRERHIALQIFDGDTPSDETLMDTTTSTNGLAAAEAAFVATVPLELGGRIWTLRFTALPSLRADQGKALIVAGSGLLISVLLWAIAWSLARNRAQAAAAAARLEADLRRREQIEAQLRETETSFRYLFEKNPNPMWVFDHETLDILEVNEAAAEHYGYSLEEFRQMRITELRPAEDIPQLKSYISDRPPGLKGAGQWRHVTRDGRTIDVEIVSYALQFRQRAAALVVARDITNSKRAEEALRESEAASRGVLDSALDAYIRMDEAGRITEWNLMAEQTFGWARSEAVGSLLDKILIPPAQRKAHRRGLARFLATGEAPILNRRIEVQALHRNGKEFPVEITILAVRTNKGQVFSAFLRDLTEKKQAEAHLRQAQKMEAVGQLTGGIAHDFNNLLTVIIGNLELAGTQDADDPFLASCTKQALAAAERGASLTHRLLAFSRQQALQPMRTDLKEMIGGMISLLRRTLGEDIEIEVRLAEGLWPELADKSQAESALLNLAINARDAMPDGGKLTIEASNVTLDAEYAERNAEVEPGDYVMLAVTDTGTGMPPEVVERAFDPFFTTKEIGKGTGLGLSMIYGFAKQSGGHLKIYSELGHGTTVRLYLPRATPVQAKPSAPPVAEKDTCGNETILVVEDEEAVRKLVVRNLQSMGYRVIEAADAVQAAELLRGDEPIDLLFTDVVLPGGMTGRQLADEARALRPDMQVLFTSGYTQNSIVHQGKLDTGVHLLSKPYRRNDLSRKIREVLGAAGASEA
jgi:PAS domain S-box-containing protein